LAVSSLNYAGCFALDDPSVQPALIGDMRQAVELAAQLGAATLSVMPGPLGSLSRPEAWRRMCHGLEQILPLAEAHRVRLALEPHHPMYTDTMAVLNTLPKAVALVRELDSPWLGLLLDVYHTWWSYDVLDEYAEAADLIFNVHIDDWRHPMRDLVLDRALPGEGVMPLVELLRAIAATGYDGWYEIEVRSLDFEQSDPQVVVQRCVAAWERVWAQVSARSSA
jgi:sugar phosphate isomerase/epimerase